MPRVENRNPIDAVCRVGDKQIPHALGQRPATRRAPELFDFPLDDSDIVI